MGAEFQFWKIKKILEVDEGDGCTKCAIINATELYT